MDGLEGTGTELPFTGKSQSLRDKMKRRREAIQNLEASVVQASNSSPPEEEVKSASKEIKKPKIEEIEKSAKKDRSSKVKNLVLAQKSNKMEYFGTEKTNRIFERNLGSW